MLEKAARGMQITRQITGQITWHIAWHILCGMSGIQSSWRRLENIGEEGKSLGDREESRVGVRGYDCLLNMWNIEIIV